MTTDATQPRFSVSTSPSIAAIAKALAAAQLAMGPAIKDRIGVIPGKDGRQGYQYGYATLAACFEAIRPMHANGIAVTQIPLEGGNGVLVATLLLHESGEWIRGEMWVPIAQQSPQGYGSALSYARRYGLSALCGLASDDDDDGVAATNGPSRAAGPGLKKTSAGPDMGAFVALCELADAAESSGDLNTVASRAMKSHRDGVISDSHLEQIKATVTKKRTLINASTTATEASS